MSSPPPDSSVTPSEKADGLPDVVPDFVEQDYPELIDNVIPSRGYQMLPMVGLGASAGGIQALTTFFKALPTKTGMAYVVILHLSPTHASTLPELLARVTKMPVVQATDGQTVEADHVYVIPPGKYLAAVDGRLRLTNFTTERGKRLAIDLFFRSLADTHGPHAAAIVLSGADSDGAIGIKRIKERGGLTIAQDPDEAEHSGMPRASINTGMIDWVLAVSEMPARLLQYHDSESQLKLPPEDGPALIPPTVTIGDEAEAALRDVLIFLRTRTGRDFSYYKRATVLRRIARRMQVNGVIDVPAYLSFLRTHVGEAGALLQDLLISVTNFFRDRDSFGALEKQIPRLFEGKSQADIIRAWIPACASGEEAYSIAILLLDHAARIDSPPSLQVFACDLDEMSIQIARAGHYPDTISADVSEERLRRFFIKDHSGYHVRRELREMILFATHDLLKDPPFSRMDLVSCRNLFIYLTRDAQERAINIVHFALKPDGLMFLGASESVNEDSPLFRTVDKKHRIYASRVTSRPALPIPIAGPSSLLHAVSKLDSVLHGGRFVHESTGPIHENLGARLDRASLAELHFKLVEHFAPPSIIVNADYEIIHLSKHAGMFLKLAGGEPTANLLRLVDPALLAELRAALFQAAEMHAPAYAVNVPAQIDGKRCLVDISVTPTGDIEPGFLLVVFEGHEQSKPATAEQFAQPPQQDNVVRHLEHDLERVKEQLRDTIEQYEASTEELKASNEELQAMNEELRSATEELETNREELQSINEELVSVNQEMKGKVDELAQANSDLQNLMASTSIATVFLDRELSISRYTPTAARIFNLIPGDIGRPLAHLKHRLEYACLIDDAENVLRTLVPIEREVRGEGRTFISRLQPYRTLEDVIAGIVLTLVDVTERNRAIDDLKESEERMRLLIGSAKDYAIFTISPDRRVDSWNEGAKAMFGYSESEIIGQPAEVLFTPEDRAKGDPAREIQLAQDQGRAGNERWHARKDGSIFYGSGSVMPLRDKAGDLRGFVKIMRDLTEHQRTQEALREHIDELTRFNAVATGRENRMIDLKKEINDLCARLGESPRYALEFEREEGSRPKQ